MPTRSMTPRARLPELRLSVQYPGGKEGQDCKQAVRHAVACIGGPLLGAGAGQGEGVGFHQVAAVDNHEHADGHQDQARDQRR